MTHVQLYLRHLHYNEGNKATGQVKKYYKKNATAAKAPSREILDSKGLLLHYIIIFF